MSFIQRLEMIIIDTYEQIINRELMAWKKKILRKSGTFERISKTAQNKMNTFIPKKVHGVITESVRNLVEAVLKGSKFVSKERDVSTLSLQQKDQWVKDTIGTYKKTAVIEGAGTGAGGLLLGLADFPLLLTIKMKLLFEIAGLYGFDAKKYEERLFILHIFQLAFSSEEKRRETLLIIENWDRTNHTKELDWQEFQQEYRDQIDFVKMFQLVPGIGAAVGAYANHQLLEQLGETAMNGYRLRILSEKA